jgi:hypothetical protein
LDEGRDRSVSVRVQNRGQAERPALLWRGVSISIGLSHRAVADFDRYVWFARKPTEASNYGYGNDPIHDEEVLESDEEDRGNHTTHVTNVPLPSTTDATQASVEQLSTLSVSNDEPKRKCLATSAPESRPGAPTTRDQKDYPTAQPSTLKDPEEHTSSHGERRPAGLIPASKTENQLSPPTASSRPTEQHKASSPQG